MLGSVRKWSNRKWLKDNPWCYWDLWQDWIILLYGRNSMGPGTLNCNAQIRTPTPRSKHKFSSKHGKLFSCWALPTGMNWFDENKWGSHVLEVTYTLGTLWVLNQGCLRKLNDDTTPAFPQHMQAMLMIDDVKPNHSYVHTNMCVRMYIYIYIQIIVCMYIYIYTYATI